MKKLLVHLIYVMNSDIKVLNNSNQDLDNSLILNDFIAAVYSFFIKRLGLNKFIPTIYTIADFIYLHHLVIDYVMRIMDSIDENEYAKIRLMLDMLANRISLLEEMIINKNFDKEGRKEAVMLAVGDMIALCEMLIKYIYLGKEVIIANNNEESNLAVIAKIKFFPETILYIEKIATEIEKNKNDDPLVMELMEASRKIKEMRVDFSNN